MLVELCFVIVSLLGGNRGLKLSLNEFFNHLLNVVFDRVELGLHGIALIVCFFDIKPGLSCFVSELADLPLFFSLILLRQKLVFFYLGVQVLIVVLQGIGLLIQHIDVIKQTVVLILSFDKSCNDFINVRNTRVVFDLIEGLLYDCRISHVLVHDPLLLFVDGHDLVNSELQDHNGVGENFRFGTRGALGVS